MGILNTWQRKHLKIKVCTREKHRSQTLPFKQIYRLAYRIQGVGGLRNIQHSESFLLTLSVWKVARKRNPSCSETLRSGDERLIRFYRYWITVQARKSGSGPIISLLICCDDRTQAILFEQKTISFILGHFLQQQVAHNPWQAELQ